jgi:glycosyltransferase involved in cell wall biosynthesis
MALTWFVPGNFPPTTGAIVFDTKLGAALSAMGHAVSITPLGGAHPWPDGEARVSAEKGLAAALRISGESIVIDGFCLYAFAGLAEELESAGAICMVHHPMSHEPQLSAAEREGYAAVERALLPHLAHIVVPSEAVRAQLASIPGLPADRVTVITPGLPDAPRSSGSGDSGCHLLAIASLIPRKGFDTVLNALQPLSDLDWRLTICGDQTIDPDHSAMLHALASGPGLSGRVTFTGPCTAAELEVLWQSADIFVSGSQYEGYGMAVAEAVRRGLPLAVTKGAAAPEVIPLAGSVVVETGDALQLSKGLRRLIFDRAARLALADAAWEAGRKLPTWESQARRFASLLPS